jgi:hypothetical protein
MHVFQCWAHYVLPNLHGFSRKGEAGSSQRLRRYPFALPSLYIRIPPICKRGVGWAKRSVPNNTMHVSNVGHTTFCPTYMDFPARGRPMGSQRLCRYPLALPSLYIRIPPICKRGVGWAKRSVPNNTMHVSNVGHTTFCPTYMYFPARGRPMGPNGCAVTHSLCPACISASPLSVKVA